MRTKSYDLIPATASEALARWDAGESVFTIEMGGIGPGYEQAIHILVFEIIRDYLDKPVPALGTPMNGWADDTVHRVNQALDRWGYSGAQVGAAKNLAYHYLRDGWKTTIDSFPHRDRHIQVQRGYPTSL